MAFLNKGLEIVFRDERAEQRAEDHVPVQGRHRRLRQAPQRLEGAAVLQGVPVRGRRRGRPDARHRDAVEHRLLRGHPRLRQRHLHHRGRHARRGLQDRAHHAWSTSTPAPRTCSRRRTRTSSARTSARASPPSSSVKLRDPQFEGQTKAKLGNVPMRSFVQKATNERLAEWLEENPTEANRIVKKASPRHRPASRRRTPATRSAARRRCPAPACPTS